MNQIIRIMHFYIHSDQFKSTTVHAKNIVFVKYIKISNIYKMNIYFLKYSVHK